MADWTCARSGCCCQSPVGMTAGEWAVLRLAAPDVPVVVETMPDGRVEVSAPAGGPCAFYDGGCTVYEVRPGVCRAFGCFRREGEPYRGLAGMLGRAGQSAGVRRVAIRMMDEAERWTSGCG